MSRTRKHYMHPVAGLCVLIHPDPEDGALLVMERIGDEDVTGTYFACEASDLFHVGERVSGAVVKWEDSAPDEDREIDPESVIVAEGGKPTPAYVEKVCDALADPLGNNVPHRDRVFCFEAVDGHNKASFERSWLVMDSGQQGILRDIVVGGIRLVPGGRWRRVV